MSDHIPWNSRKVLMALLGPIALTISWTYLAIFWMGLAGNASSRFGIPSAVLSLLSVGYSTWLPRGRWRSLTLWGGLLTLAASLFLLVWSAT